MSFTISIENPHPSQLYIDAQKLRELLGWFDADTPEYDPIPILIIDDEMVLSDGHTRAFLAHLTGVDTIEVIEDPDRDELNLDLYRECVGWCRDEDVTTIADLTGRVVSRETFMDRWVARCHASPHYSDG